MDNKAREVNNPIIKQLLDETNPEELAKIDAEMTNNKQQTEINAVEYLDKVNQFAKENSTDKPRQQTAIEWLEKQTRKPEWHSLKRGDIFEQAKEKYEHEMCEFAAEYAQYELQQNKPGIKGAMVSMCAWTFFKNRKQ